MMAYFCAGETRANTLQVDTARFSSAEYSLALSSPV